MWELINKLGLGLGIFWLLVVIALAIGDGQVFEFPNGTLKISNSEIDWKSKSK